MVWTQHYNNPEFLVDSIIFTFMHLADAFIQSDLQCIQVKHILSVCITYILICLTF